MISLSSNLQERKYKHPLKFLIQAEIQWMSLTKFMWRVCWWRVLCNQQVWTSCGESISLSCCSSHRARASQLLSDHLQVIEQLAAPQTHCCSNCSCFQCFFHQNVPYFQFLIQEKLSFVTEASRSCHPLTWNQWPVG